MKKYRICVDSGTTNTRLMLVENGKEIDRIKMNVGAGSTAVTGSNDLLKKSFSENLGELLKRNGLTEKDVELISLSGMITSELGLYNLPHIPAPAGKDELRKGSVTVTLSDVTDIPMCFIPGVKVMSDNALDIDIMRGEETELCGISALSNLEGGFTLMLPGTHNKIIFTDSMGRISSFFTAMSGEMLKAVCDNTILKDAVSEGFTKTPDKDHLLLGYDTAKELGVTGACFKTRILSKFTDGKSTELYSFLLGVILHEDVSLALKKASGGRIILGGSEPFKTALSLIFTERTSLAVTSLSEEISEGAVCAGQLCIIE